MAKHTLIMKGLNDSDGIQNPVNHQRSRFLWVDWGEPLTVFARNSSLDVRLGSEYTSIIGLH